MKLQTKIAVAVSAMAMTASPAALAMAKHDGVPHGAAKGHEKAAKAYGKHCQGESKQHVKGEKGTAFS
ncbi:MAG: hypothetical protein WDZ46_01055, partial [Solirubrobacterales bacterium]